MHCINEKVLYANVKCIEKYCMKHTGATAAVTNISLVLSPCQTQEATNLQLSPTNQLNK